ncbi:MAG: hypothetical protein ACE149_04905 [Armatimonadota bacterium]
MKAVRRKLALWGTEGEAVVVETGHPWRLILWEKAQYVPCWDLGGDVWFTPEWFETSSPEDPHCYEVIMDKDCRFSEVHIRESGPARATVHWKNALCNSLYRIFHGDTRSEEYYRVYPDGVAVRQLVGWPGQDLSDGLNPGIWEVEEFILINGPGVRPQDCIEPIGFTLTNLAGDALDLPWPHPFKQGKALCELKPEIADWSEYVGVVHLRDHPSPFVAFPRNRLLFPFANCQACGKPHQQMNAFAGASNYSHWPANDSREFVGWVLATEEEVQTRATHTSFVNCGYSYGGVTPPRPSSWLFLTGAVTGGVDEARRLAGSWLGRAKVESSHLFEGYAYSQRAYCFRASAPGPVRIKLAPTQPIINPVLRLYFGRPPVRVSWNGRPLPDSEFCAQPVDDDVLIWIGRTLDEETTLEIGLG